MWKFFEKYGLNDLVELYITIFESWQKAFEIKKSMDLSVIDNRQAITNLLKTAENCEKAAVKFAATLSSPSRRAPYFLFVAKDECTPVRERV